MPSDVEQIAQLIAGSQSTIVFTGAGISTESGIPDFRSPGGVWEKSQPVYFDDYLRSPESRVEYWQQKAELHNDFADADPNITHQVLSRWESMELLHGVITQNIDGLHQQAGNKNVLELHGTAREIACLDCGWRADAGQLVEQFRQTQVVPACPVCHGITKHATISFGQSLPTETLRRSMQWAREADCFLALGSSLVVHPAASLPPMAKESGAQLIIINRDKTPFDSVADIVIHESLGETMAAIDDALTQLQSSH